MNLSEFPRWAEHFYEHKQRWVIGVGSFVLGAVILIGYAQSGPDEVCYVVAEEAYETWARAPQDEALYLSMARALRKVPQLEKKYEARIAQGLLDAKRTDQALSLARSAVLRIREEVPYHSSFGFTTLLIEQGEYQEALQHAVQLKEQMKPLLESFAAGHTLEAGAFLYAQNLIRIASLQQQLKNLPGERVAWEELEEMLQQNADLSALMKKEFSEKNLDLSAYIAERRKSFR